MTTPVRHRIFEVPYLPRIITHGVAMDDSRHTKLTFYAPTIKVHNSMKSSVANLTSTVRNILHTNTLAKNSILPYLHYISGAFRKTATRS